MHARQSQESIAARLDDLPTLPAIVYELSKVINDPMSSTNDVERIMSNDQSLTTKVLRLVNSAYYAIPGGVTTLSRAIAHIGFDAVNQLVLSASILKALETKGPQIYDMNEFWKHSIGVAISAETIAKHIQHPTSADLFTCGLVHDMGKVALYTILPEDMLAIVEHAQKKSVSYSEAEAELGITPHTKIGQMLAQKWRLPIGLSATIAFHHHKDPQHRAGTTADLQRDIDIVYLANLLTHALKFGKSGHAKVLGAPRDVMQRLSLNPEIHLKPLLGEIRSNLDKASDFLRVLTGSTS